MTEAIPIDKLNELKAYPLYYRLQKLRFLYGYTQKELARILNCSTTIISFWENGHCVPYGKNLEKIISLYNLPDDFFVDIDIERAKLN